MRAIHLYETWSAYPESRMPQRVLTGFYKDDLGEGDYYPVVEVYRDEGSEEVVVQYADEAVTFPSDENDAASDWIPANALTCAELLAKLQVAMGEDHDWQVDATTAPADRHPDHDARSDGPSIRIDFPVLGSGGVDSLGLLFLFWSETPQPDPADD